MVTVLDPFGVTADPMLPTLSAALNPSAVDEQIAQRLPALTGGHGRVHVLQIRVIRYKPRRRCVVEYLLRIERADGTILTTTVIGKVRARRFGNEGYRRLRSLWECGFQDDSADGISVPEPLGVIPLFQMWFQRKAPGREFTEYLTTDEAPDIALRIAEAAHKVHRLAPSMSSTHDLSVELAILQKHLPLVIDTAPGTGRRIYDILAACEEIVRRTDSRVSCAIHRDFYPDQVIVTDDRLYLLDFDLCCQGDPALDIGNFVGHIQEYAVRHAGGLDRLEHVEKAIVDRYVELAGQPYEVPIRIYTLLTLVRHIYISAQFPDRRPFTTTLMEACESRLADFLQGASA